MNSRRKGARGEREWAAWLRRVLGVEARRGQQYSGLGGRDVVSSLPIHWEVKRTEALSLYPAVEQAVRDAAEDEVPVVAHRRSRREWLLILRAADLLRLVEAVKGRKNEDS